MTPDAQSDDTPSHVRQLLAIRLKHGWSQRRLAYELSVCERTIRNWESGATQPNARDHALFHALLTATGSAGESL